MNSKQIDANDPRLTAYVLGELDETDCQLVEEHLQTCEVSRAAVVEIRKTVQTLEAQLATEPALELTAEQRNAIEAACLSQSDVPDTEANDVASTADDEATVVADCAVSSAIPVHPKRRHAVWAMGLATVAMVVVPVLIVIAIENLTDTPQIAVNENGEEFAGEVAMSEAKEASSESRHSPANNLYLALKTIKGSTSHRSDRQLQDESSIPKFAELDSEQRFGDGVVRFDGGKSQGSSVSSRRNGRAALSSSDSNPKDFHDYILGAQTSSRIRDSEESAKRRPSTPKDEKNVSVGFITSAGNAPLTNKPNSLSSEGKPQSGRGRVVPKNGSINEDLNGNGVLDSSGFSNKAGTIVGRTSTAPEKIPAGGRRSTAQPAASKRTLGLLSEGEAKRSDAASLAQTPASNEGQAGQNASGFAVIRSERRTKEFVRYRRRIEVYYQELEEGRGRRRQAQPSGRESYAPIVENEFLSPVSNPLSTLSIDVDTASYANVRRFLNRYQWPNPDAVRIEEMLNYFHYDYPQPEDGTPFSVSIEVAACPWQAGHRLARIGLKGKEILRDQRPPSNLVFLLDVSGSMRDSNKLPLVKSSMELLVQEMTEDDRIAIVTYSGKAGVRLQSTTGNDKETIFGLIRGLNAGGSTNGEAGIQLAYDQALNHFIKDGANRIILCTDGDFNVGVSGDNALVKMIKNKARTGVFLSIFGFGMGNLKDSKLEQLADNGNGHYGYVDNINEARKVFIEELTGTLYTIAKDVKVQVEFNPGRVGAYRLIGYENRVMAAEDFNNDRKDAGDIGAGHTVTALYEIIPPGKLPPLPTVDDLKYQPKQKKDGAAKPKQAGDEEPQEWSDELFTVKLNYKQPDADQSQRHREFSVKDQPDGKRVQPSRDFQWAASVASFGILLRHSKHSGDANFAQVLEMALASKGPDKSGYRREFVDLVYSAQAIQAREQGRRVETPKPLALDAGRTRAKVGNKYANLLKTIEVPSDWERYGTFNEFGHWSGENYSGHKSLPEAYWVYVYPNWFLWQNQTASKD